MIRNFEEVIKRAGDLGPKRGAIFYPHEEDVILSIAEATSRGYIEPLLIGDREKIKSQLREVGLSGNGLQIIQQKDPQEASDLCVRLVMEGKADFIIKGNIITTYLYRSLIKVTSSLDISLVPSTLCFHEVAGVDHLFVITDPGVNIAPDLDTKVKIIRNAVAVLQKVGYQSPRVMILSGARAIDQGLPSLQEALIIKEMAKGGELGECTIEDFHNLVDLLNHPSKGFPDILLVPQIEAGNILVKAIDHLGIGKRQCVTVGAGIIALTPSRSDDHEVRLLNIALGVLLSGVAREDKIDH